MRSDHREFLLFEGIDPTDVHMGVDSARKPHGGKRDIRHAGVEESLPDTADLIRQLPANQRKDHRDVMRGETPERIFFTADFTKI